MKLLQEISRDFEKNALKYFSEDFEKHKNYLLKAAFGRNSASIPKKEFEDAIIVWGIDSQRCVKELLNVLLPVIRKTMETIQGRQQDFWTDTTAERCLLSIPAVVTSRSRARGVQRHIQ